MRCRLSAQQPQMHGQMKSTGTYLIKINLGEMFLPCVYEFNDNRKQIVSSLMVMFDESMSGWQHKTSKLGGLPNISFDPHKPVPPGTMFFNGADCMSGVLVFQDVVQGLKIQSKKEILE
jgi:hypothetical protein